MKGYKGYHKGLVCNPNGKEFKFEVGKEYEEDKAIVCKTGFHFCKNPLDVLDFYPLLDENGNDNEFTEVEVDEAITDDNKKFCSKKIKIGAKLSLKEIIDASIEFIKSESKNDDRVQSSSGYYAQLASSGNSAKLVIKGKNSVGANIGYNGTISGVIGTWITLAEYDNDGIVKFVKSAQIDGIKLEENVAYKLKNKRFVKA